MNTVTIALDSARELKYNINAMVELENRFDKSIPEIFQEGKVGFAVIVGIVRIGLKAGGMKFKGQIEDQELVVGDLIQEHWVQEGKNLTQLMEVVTEALSAAGIFTSDEDKEADTSQSNPTEGTDN